MAPELLSYGESDTLSPEFPTGVGMGPGPALHGEPQTLHCRQWVGVGFVSAAVGNSGDAACDGP